MNLSRINTSAFFLLIFFATAPQAHAFSIKAANMNTEAGDRLPFTETLIFGDVGPVSTDVTVKITAHNDTNERLFSNFFRNRFVVQSKKPTVHDSRYITADEYLSFKVTGTDNENWGSSKINLTLSSISVYGLQEGEKIEFLLNGQVLETAEGTGSRNKDHVYSLGNIKNVQKGDEIILVTTGDWQLNRLNFLAKEIQTSKITNSNLVKSSQTYRINQYGRYFVDVDLTEQPLQNQTIVATVYDKNSQAFRKLSQDGPVTRFDLGILKPREYVVVDLKRIEGTPNRYVSLVQERTYYTSDASIPRAGSAPYRLSNKDLFENLFPQMHGFRLDNRGETSTSFEQYVDLMVGDIMLGLAPKQFGEEDTNRFLHPEYMSEYARVYPEKIALNHVNARMATIIQTEDSQFYGSERIEPAHIQYLPGTSVSEPVDKDQRAITLDEHININKIRSGDPEGLGNNYGTLVYLDKDGNQDWGKSEFVALTEYKKRPQELTIIRGVLDTSPLSYPYGAYFAPAANLGNKGAYDGDDTKFIFNYSAWAPLDSQGSRTSEALSSIMIDWFSPGGPLEDQTGIMFDVLDRNPRPNNVDTNVDGVVDEGYDERGVNMFELGIYDFVRRLRIGLGEDRIITGDGIIQAREQRPRVYNLYNGIELEGFTSWADAYITLWSDTMNLMSFHQSRNPSDHPFNLIAPKFRDLGGVGTLEYSDVGGLYNMNVVGCAIVNAACSGRHFQTTEDGDYTLVDLAMGGDKEDPQWLGKAMGKKIHLGLQARDLLEGKGVSMANNFVSKWTAGEDDVHVKKVGDTLVISADDTDGWSEEVMSATLNDVKIPAGDVIIKFEVLANDPNEFPDGTGRYFNVLAHDRFNQDVALTADSLTAMADTEWYPVSFYYREAGPATIDIELNIDGKQDFAVRNVEIHSATDAVAREFEHGVALLNPSNKPYTFDIESLFPGAELKELRSTGHDIFFTKQGEVVTGDYQLAPYSGTFLEKI